MKIRMNKGFDVNGSRVCKLSFTDHFSGRLPPTVSFILAIESETRRLTLSTTMAYAVVTLDADECFFAEYIPALLEHGRVEIPSRAAQFELIGELRQFMRRFATYD